MLRHLIALTASLLLAGAALAADTTRVEQQRQDIRKTGDQAMAELLQRRPELSEKIERAAGYGAFNSVGVQVAFFGGGGGSGVVVDKTTGREHFMRMAQVTAGIGLGVKDLRIVFIFHDVESMNKFVYSGWEFGGEAEAGAKSGDKGGAAAVNRLVDRGIEVFPLTQAGVSATATLGGTKYWKDGSLN
jgi:lipid-binding SYLF domain-containing protein